MKFRFHPILYPSAIISASSNTYQKSFSLPSISLLVFLSLKPSLLSQAEDGHRVYAHSSKDLFPRSHLLIQSIGNSVLLLQLLYSDLHPSVQTTVSPLLWYPIEVWISVQGESGKTSLGKV